MSRLKTITAANRALELVREHGSYRAAAEAVGMSLSQLSKILDGICDPRPRMRIKMGLCATARYERLDDCEH